MANFIRLGVTRVLTNKLVQSTSKKTKYSIAPSLVRQINTSSKPTQASADSSITPTAIEESTDKNVEYWQCYGFDPYDKWMDRFLFHSTMFCVVSLCFVGGIFVFAYQPDHKLIDWCQREAYLQLRYREDHGLPLIDPNYIDPSKVKLPTDEELGDTEIII
ncbi:NADH dehydrogenase [ubiquinone] 1 beta subcomplex subunit 11, mitochondrial [Chelonus insularis]|uniref:NADH dehydrogenase [ubiquinone] 1 beta subcomplex subunit 11, mitochondrial n=1 Tax=Chelonus insularis TaxID=460826 RepID=UPI001589EB3A|nr:NADH dehydrogenase [ubiquinone] 1 beta subcomplex subunit 11, mitochondrial [Chelonus insularis]